MSNQPPTPNPFQKDFATTVMESGLLATSTVCSFEAHPAARTAKLNEWHQKQIVFLNESYSSERLVYFVLCHRVLLCLNSFYFQRRHLYGRL
jgi:hypothetical protein